MFSGQEATLALDDVSLEALIVGMVERSDHFASCESDLAVLDAMWGVPG